MIEFTHSELVEIAYKWVMQRSGFAFKELKTCNEEPDVIGFRSGESFLVECKKTRSDFLSDKNKPFRIRPELGMGKFRFFLCPKDLISIEELPENWGLIYVNEKGKARCVYNPYGKGNIYSSWDCFSPRNESAERQMMYSALRRLQIRGLVKEIYTKIDQ